jgi:beta-galactosidase
MWNDVVYTPGEIKVVAYDAQNKAVAEQIIRTAGDPKTIKLTADRSVIQADGKDLSFVTIEMLDKNGNPCPRADLLLFFEVSGVGKLKALCNGNAIDQTSFSSNYMRLFNGKLVAVIESTEASGEITIKASGSNLEHQSIVITSK